MVTVGIDIPSSERAVEISERRGIYAGVGVHPNSASEWDASAESALDAMASDERVAAIGETGLDFYRDRAPRDAQVAAFAAQIALAKRHDKGLIIHTRDSLDDALDVLADEGPPARFVFHCWSGDEKQMRTAVELGAYVSFAGNVSFPSAGDLREVAAVVPGDRLLVETDSPFLTPVPHRGKSNEPRFVPFVGVALAQVRDVSAHLLAEQTATNARALLG